MPCKTSFSFHQLQDTWKIEKEQTRKTVVELERHGATRMEPTYIRMGPRTPGHEKRSHGHQDTRKAPMTL